jgi:CRP/FNR family transcriptional regulator, cyclic AMP receptor protein
MGDHSKPEIRWTILEPGREVAVPENAHELKFPAHPQEIDPLFLFACHMEWERSEQPSAGWELIAAAQSPRSETRSHARALLSSSRHLGGIGLSEISPRKRQSRVQDEMKAPYGLDIIEDCCKCPESRSGRFCNFSQLALESLSEASHKNVLPAGAILFVEGQTPRGVYIECSGKVNLSTTSRKGKILILMTAGAGEAPGLSAAVSGVTYETTAETSTPCHLSFIDRNHFLELMESHCEIGLHTARCLSRDYQAAYRDIHHLVLTRSSAGKLPTPKTHEEMAMRIGASRETVTRLLSRLEGSG